MLLALVSSYVKLVRSDFRVMEVDFVVLFVPHSLGYGILVVGTSVSLV